MWVAKFVVNVKMIKVTAKFPTNLYAAHNIKLDGDYCYLNADQKISMLIKTEVM
jgi:hypothetical protein